MKCTKYRWEPSKWVLLQTVKIQMTLTYVLLTGRKKGLTVYYFILEIIFLVWKTPTKRMPGINVDKIYARNMFFLTKSMPGIDYVDKIYARNMFF